MILVEVLFIFQRSQRRLGFEIITVFVPLFAHAWRSRPHLLAITPFVGTLGVAAEQEVATSIDGQGPWGGNLDVRDVAQGNRIYLPVFHEGDRFYLGDVHASQGDTEFSGTAAETKATVRLRLDLVKGKTVPWMRIEKPESIVSVYAFRPLEDAVQTAVFFQPDGLADCRIRLYAVQCLLHDQHLSRFPHQCLPNGKNEQTQLCCRCGDSQTASMRGSEGSTQNLN